MTEMTETTETTNPNKPHDSNKYLMWIIVFGAVILRMILAMFDNLSHPSDMGTFRIWSYMLNELGLSGFYGDPRFTDYPPGYMYILGFLGMLRNLFNMELFGPLYGLVVKMPAILADAATIVLIYKIATEYDKNVEGENLKSLFPLGAALLYALNPAIIINSAVWGQVDSIHTLLLALSIYLITKEKMLPSVLIFSISFMVKPQSFMLAPIFLFMFYKYVFGIGRPKFNGKKLKQLLLFGLACVVLIVVMTLPFIDFGNLPPSLLDLPVLRQYIDTFGTYSFVTHNAYNFYALLGLNHHVSIHEVAFLGVTYNAVGMAFIVLITLASFIFLWRKHGTGSVFMVGAFLVIATFMLSARMHERYNFPALALLLISGVALRDKRIIWLYVGFSAAFFLNYVDVLMMSINNFNFSQVIYTARLFAVPAVLVFLWFIYILLTHFVKEPLFNFKFTMPAFAIKRKDLLICGAITLFYAIFAFTNLGNTQSVQTHYDGEVGRPVVVDFGSVTRISAMQFFSGPPHHQQFTIEFALDLNDWHGPMEVFIHNVFYWHYREFGYGHTRYARITPVSHRFRINEMAFRDETGELIPVTVLTANGHAMFDEQHLVPDVGRDYMHSTYFDEIYHPRTAYEFLHGLPVYEWTHPPLGKVIMAGGIAIFGMTPFGWRFTGTLLGVLMLPLMYIFAKKMFDSTFFAAFATFIFAFDFMHYAQTRLATIDTYVVFFILGMYLCMYIYTRMSFFEQPLVKTLLPLLVCGIFAGLAIASKWQGVYGVIGIAVIFFWTLFQRFREYCKTKDLNSIQRQKFWKYTVITLVSCVVLFIVIPLGIYILSYIPYWRTGDLYPNMAAIAALGDEMDFMQRLIYRLYPHSPFLAGVLNNQMSMFNYHAHDVIGATHPFSTPWWEWILNMRPIFLYFNHLGGDMAQAISSFGNPLVWWGGIAAFLYCVYAAIFRRDKTALFLVIAYLSQIVPWIPVTRITFIYHYFPNVLFIVLMITYAFKQIFQHKNKKPAMTFAIAVFALFMLFYPVLTGIPTSREFVATWLRWLPTWIIMA